MPVYLDGVGTAKARNTVTVRPQVDGRILSINFKEGQEVKRGDVLAKIDPSTYQAQLDQAAAKKALDEAQLANAKRDLERYTKLGGNIIAQKTIDTQRALVDQLAAQIKLDDAAIANAKAFLDYTTIVAPIDGRTGIRMVDEGNLVRASDAGIVVITEIRPISVLFTLPQQQLAQVNKAQARRRAGGGGARRRRQDRARPRHAAGGRQPGRPDDRHGADEGGVPQRQSAALARPVRQRAPAHRHAEAGRGRARRRRCSAAPTAPSSTSCRGRRRPCQPAPGHRHASDRDARPSSPRASTAGERVVTTGFGRLKDGAEVTVATPEEQETAAQTDKPLQRKGKPPRQRRRQKRAQASAPLAPRTSRSSVANVERGRGMRTCLQANAAAALRRLQGCRRKQRAAPQEASRARRRAAPTAMSVSGPFIKRPIATSLLALAVDARRLRSAIGGCRSRRCRRSISRPSR